MTTCSPATAESLFWLARYMERAENLARILDVQETFARDARQPGLGCPADQRRRGGVLPAQPADGRQRAAFYVLDGDNPTSIVCSVHAARENARTLRPLISTEMWMQINVFHNRSLALEPRTWPRSNSPACATGSRRLQAHTGITEGTFYRDQGWYFYQIGAHRARRPDHAAARHQVPRLLPRPTGHRLGHRRRQWNALLRSAAGYHAYRRGHPRGMRPSGWRVPALRTCFPRSVAC